MTGRFLLFCAILFASFSPLQARDRQIGNIIFQPPKDWSLGNIRDEGWATLRNEREDERCELCYIYIHVGTTPRGSFDRWVRERMKVALDDGKVDKVMETKVSKDRRLGEVHTYSRVIKDRGKKMQMFMAFKMKDRWEMIHFSGNIRNKKRLLEVGATLQEEFLPMLTRLGFVSKGRKPVIGKPVSGDLDGVWFGSRTVYGSNFDGTMRIDIRPVIFTFWPDGRFYKGIPASGLSTFDIDTAVLTETTEFGNYILKDDEVRLFYADGDRDVLRREGDEFEDGNATLWKVRLAEDGYRFDGRLYSINYSPFGPGTSGGAVFTKNVKFFEDGTYTSDGFSGVSGDTGSTAFTFADKKKTERGRYEISDGLIRLTPPKGRGEMKIWPFFLQESKGGWRPIVRGKYLEKKK